MGILYPYSTLQYSALTLANRLLYEIN